MGRFLNHLDLSLVSIAKSPWKVPVKVRQNLMGRTLCMPHPSGQSRFITASLAKGYSLRLPIGARDDISRMSPPAARTLCLTAVCHIV